MRWIAKIIFVACLLGAMMLVLASSIFLGDYSEIWKSISGLLLIVIVVLLAIPKPKTTIIGVCLGGVLIVSIILHFLLTKQQGIFSDLYVIADLLGIIVTSYLLLLNKTSRDS